MWPLISENIKPLMEAENISLLPITEFFNTIEPFPNFIKEASSLKTELYTLLRKL